MTERIILSLMLLLTLPALAASSTLSATQQRTALQARLNTLAKTGSALPSAHKLSKRYAAIIAECRDWDRKLKAVEHNPDAAEDIEALLWRFTEAVHRLGMLELRTRIVQATPGPEPRYGLLASTGLERIVDNRVPEVPVSTKLTLDAAPGETVTGRLVLIVFDRGISKPAYPSTLQFVTCEALTGADGAAIPAEALVPFFEDAVPADNQRFMGADPVFARGVQRTNYLTGASQDFLMGLGWLNYIFYLHADTSWAIRLRLNVPANQPAGIYRGRVRVWPLSEDDPAYASIEVRVHDVIRPAPTMMLLGGLNVKAFNHLNAVHAKKPAGEVDPSWLTNHLAKLAQAGIQAKAEDMLSPQKGWLFVPDDPYGPLALTTTPLRARLLAWQAWAQGLKGVQVARVHDWTGTTEVMAIWPGPGNPRGYNNFVKDPGRLGSLYYPWGESLRLLALREGFQDAAWLSTLQTAIETSPDPAWRTVAQATLQRARALAAAPDAATPAAVLATRAEVITLLERNAR